MQVIDDQQGHKEACTMHIIHVVDCPLRTSKLQFFRLSPRNPKSYKNDNCKKNMSNMPTVRSAHLYHERYLNSSLSVGCTSRSPQQKSLQASSPYFPIPWRSRAGEVQGPRYSRENLISIWALFLWRPIGWSSWASSSSSAAEAASGEPHLEKYLSMTGTATLAVVLFRNIQATKRRQGSE